MENGNRSKSSGSSSYITRRKHRVTLYSPSLLLWVSLLIFSCNLQATILTTNQIVDWKPGMLDVGGIPTYPQGIIITNAPYNGRGDGTTDNTAAITAAILACPNGQAIFFPSGTYKINSHLQIDSPKSIVLRGTGTNSILNFASTVDFEAFRFSGSGSTTANANSGYTRNSHSIVLASAAGFTAGNYCIISQDNDPAWMEGNIPNASGRYQSQMFRLTSVVGNTINFDRPLYYSYNPAMNVTVRKIDPITGCGLENLKLNTTGTSLDAVIQFFYAVNCWMVDVESEMAMNVSATHVAISSSYKNEIRRCYMHHGMVTGSTPYGTSLDERSCDNLIEDSIYYYLRHGIVIQNGANGNVAGYNFTARMFDVNYPATDFLMPSIECHGGEPNWNLIEGNIGTELMADNFWGSSHYNTFFRNWSWRYSQGETKTVTIALYAFRVDAMNLFENIVANWTSIPGQTLGGINSSIWMFGDSNLTLDPTTPPGDPRVTFTMVLHGNFDFVTQAIQWDPAIADHSPIASYYRTSKPSFMTGFNWPPIGPGVPTTGITTNNILIPAQARFLGVNNASNDVVLAPPQQATKLRMMIVQ